MLTRIIHCKFQRNKNSISRSIKDTRNYVIHNKLGIESVNIPSNVKLREKDDKKLVLNNKCKLYDEIK